MISNLVLNIHIIWDGSKTRFGLLNNLRIIKTNTVKLKSLNGCDAIRKNLMKIIH